LSLDCCIQAPPMDSHKHWVDCWIQLSLDTSLPRDVPIRNE
jgi:hypothetical protein